MFLEISVRIHEWLNKDSEFLYVWTEILLLMGYNYVSSFISNNGHASWEFNYIKI